jgi:dUTPase
MSISAPFYVTPALQEVLDSHNIETYGPAYGDSVGLDLYNASGQTIVIPPASDVFSTQKKKFKVLIDTGLKVSLRPGQGGFIEERGSITKTTLKVRAGVIDPSYTGNIFVNCVNLGNEPVVIQPHAKLPFQLVVKQCISFQPISKEYFEILAQEATRGEGKLGSSD